MDSKTRQIHALITEQVDIEQFHQEMDSHPFESLIVEYQDRRQVDLGALCYTSRVSYKKNVVLKVDQSTLRPERSHALRNWLSAKATIYYSGGRIRTFHSSSNKFKMFLDWSDKHDCQDVLQSASAFHSALKKFSHNLLQRLATGTSKPQHFYNLQTEVQKAGWEIFPNSNINFSVDVPRIPYSGGHTNATLTPSQEDMASHLTLCDFLFRDITAFILEFKKFPFTVMFLDQRVLLMPAEYVISTSALLAVTRKKIMSSIYWDYERGGLRTFEDCKIRSHTANKDGAIRYQLEIKRRVLQASNSDLRHSKRLELAKLSHDAFLSLFVANTAFNEEQVRNLPWAGNFAVESSKNHGFQTIKYRAAGRNIKIEIKKTFIKDFKLFLKLRDYICERTEHPYLFVGMRSYLKDSHLTTSMLQYNAIARFNKTIKDTIAPNHKGLGYRELRKYKSSYLLAQNYPIQVVSAIMQSGEQAIRKSYADGHEKSAIDEISAMLNRLTNLLENYNGEQTPAGDCLDSGSPKSEIEAPSGYEPNCNSFVGCIFCVHFQTHVDEESIRKILSMRFFIHEYIALCEDAEQFQKTHGGAILRIDMIMEQLLLDRPEIKTLVNTISEEITSEYKLTPYWNRQYQRLLNIGSSR